MILEVLFWVFLILLLVFGGWRGRSDYSYLGGFGIVWLLLAILGWKVFGSPVK
jgi:hypothetical protein